MTSTAAAPMHYLKQVGMGLLLGIVCIPIAAAPFALLIATHFQFTKPVFGTAAPTITVILVYLLVVGCGVAFFAEPENEPDMGR